MGFLGPGPVSAHLDHAAGFVAAIQRDWAPDEVLRSATDLGSGGGVPGLPLALAFPYASWTLVDSNVRRTAFVRQAVITLGLSDRVTVLGVRAEELGRQDQRRRSCQLVVARGFGGPAVTAECAAALLVVGGRAVVSEPPGGDSSRWPPEGLRTLGMTVGPAVRQTEGSFQVLVQASPCPNRFPRRVGIPAKRPLF